MFGIITYVDNNISVSVHLEDSNFHDVITQVAINWIYDNAGKNNYNDTLTSDLPENLCPAGYVLKYNPDGNHEQYIRLYHNTEVDDSGWIFSGKKMSTIYRGFFGKVKITTNEPLNAAKDTIAVLEKRLKSANDELDRRMGVIDYPQSEPRKQSMCGKNDIQDEMIKLIKNFDFGTLRPIAGTYRRTHVDLPLPDNIEEYDELINENNYAPIDSDDDSSDDSSDETESDYSSD
jgi:hypothetical protein